MAIELELLKSIAYFAGLSTAELEAISHRVFEKTAERGEIILLEGEPAEELYFVVSGVVKVFKTSAEGKEQILDIASAGETFNDIPVFDDGPNLASAQAMGTVVLYGLRKEELRLHLQEQPKVALNSIRVLVQRVRQLVSLVEDLSFRHVIGRIARLLLENAGDGARPGPRLTQQEMAAIAGTTREVVGRSLKTLEEEGAIKLDRHRIVVTDLRALKERVAIP